jgi:PAS domain S-box-containing protein
MTFFGRLDDRWPEELRGAAESCLEKKPIDVSGMSTEGVEQVVFELEVHQEELKIQNEELRHTQLELQASNARISDLYNYAPVGYVTIDASGSIMESNLSAATMLGRNCSAVVGLRIAIFWTVESRTIFNDYFELVWSTQQNQTCEVKLLSQNGPVLYLRLDSNFDATDLSGIDQMRMVMTDITCRRQAENALLEKDNYLDSIMDSAPIFIVYVDQDQRLKFSNKAFQEWFLGSEDDLAKQTISEVFSQQSNFELSNHLRDAFQGRTVDFELELGHPSKGIRLVQIILVPDVGVDGQAKGVHCFATDVTERRVVERQNASRRELEGNLTRLSSGDRDVFNFLMRGKGNKSIAFALDLGLRTVERRRQTIFLKLNVETLSELLAQYSASQNPGPDGQFGI